MQKVIRVCDLDDDPMPAVSRLDLTLDGHRTVLDLCADHLVEVRASLSSVVGTHGETAGVSPRGSRWGRIPEDVTAAYAQAHGAGASV